MYCRHCGQSIDEKAEYCVSCGCNPKTGEKYCQNCGVNTNQNQEICTKCGVRLMKYGSVSTPNGQLNLNFSYLEPYWQSEFKQIHESNEAYNGKWNWAAFFCNTFWAFTKGCWGLGLVFLVANICTAGVLSIPIMIYSGIRGNKIYYNRHVKNQQTLF